MGTPLIVSIHDERGIYNFFQNLEEEIEIDKETSAVYDSVISSVGALQLSGTEKAKAESVVKYIEDVRGRAVGCADDVEKNISDILKARDALLSIGDFDVSEIRLSIDELLKSWESRYYNYDAWKGI